MQNVQRFGQRIAPSNRWIVDGRTADAAVVGVDVVARAEEIASLTSRVLMVVVVVEVADVIWAAERRVKGVLLVTLML